MERNGSLKPGMVVPDSAGIRILRLHFYQKLENNNHSGILDVSAPTNGNYVSNNGEY